MKDLILSSMSFQSRNCFVFYPVSLFLNPYFFSLLTNAIT